MGGHDRTADFRQRCTVLRLENNWEERGARDKKHPTTQPHPFTVASLRLHSAVLDMHSLVKKSETAYLARERFLSSSSNSSTLSSSSHMTDSQRVWLEDEITRFVLQGKNQLSTLVSAASTKGSESACHRAHKDMVVTCLNDHLQALMQRMLDLRVTRTQQLKQDAARGQAADFFTKDDESDDEDEEDKVEGISNYRVSPSHTPLLASDDHVPPVLSAVEQQQFAEENSVLVDWLDNSLDQIQQSEQKLSEIAKLMTLFADNVVQQAEVVEEIFQHAETSTNLVDKAADELQKAIDRGVENRILTLFTIVLAALSLLFLDWYM